MARIEKMVEKIEKLGKKQNLSALSKMAKDPDDEVRAAVARGLGMIQNYDAGMQLIPLLRDSSPLVRASAAEAVGTSYSKNCEEYLKKLAYNDPEPDVRVAAKKAYDKIRTRSV